MMHNGIVVGFIHARHLFIILANGTEYFLNWRLGQGRTMLLTKVLSATIDRRKRV